MVDLLHHRTLPCNYTIKVMNNNKKKSYYYDLVVISCVLQWTEHKIFYMKNIYLIDT